MHYIINMSRRRSSRRPILSIFELPVPALIKRGDEAFLEENYDDALDYYNRGLEQERKHDYSSTDVAFLLHKIGMVLAQQGDSYAAMTSFEEALKIRQEKLGPGSEDAAETTAQMTKVLDDIRKQTGVGERQYVKGKSDVEEKAVSLDIGTNLFEWGEYKEAEEVLRQCVDSMNANKESSDSDKYQALITLAALNSAQGKYDEAKALYLEALKTAKKMDEESEQVDMSIVNSIAGYAEILRKAGDLWQAEALHKKVRGMLLKAKATKVDDDSDDDDDDDDADIELQIAVSHTQLGCTVFELRKYDEALDEHQSALQIRLEKLEFTDALVSESFNYCAETLCAMGYGAEALPLSLHAVDVRKKEFGSSHPAYAHALCVLAQAYNIVGRSGDALPLIETCLEICEAAFQKKNHANIIPNLLVYGDILYSVGETKKALDTLQRAEEIHKSNFKPGLKDIQLERCKKKIKNATRAMKKDLSSQHSNGSSTSSNDSLLNDELVQSGGNPVIVFTDIGKDVDDVLALVVLACLKRTFILNPLAVIATLSPQDERARLARAVLDSLGLPDVPVGIGTDGGSKDSVELHCFDTGRNQNLLHASVLIPRILKEAESKSVTLLCLANLKDIGELIVKHPDLFSDKIKNVVIMGGASFSEANERLEPDETAYNNNCDPAAARMVYLECQQRNITTTTISRYAAYDCPFAISKLDNLQLKCNHLLASEIHEASTKAILTLWQKVNMPAWMSGRGRLPSRCDRDWFCRFFGVDIDDDAGPNATDSWLRSANIYLYDALATLNCVEAYQELYFCPKGHVVDGTLHKLVDRVAYKVGLVAEIDGLLNEAFRIAMEGCFVKFKTKLSVKKGIIIMDDQLLLKSANGRSNGKNSSVIDDDELSQKSVSVNGETKRKNDKAPQ
jgi:tetratricopeptide (TPR) repeat protein/inosine-uridine nucleoside N-ribohydrolase